MIVERKDPKWFLLEQVLAIVSTRRAQQEFSKYEITPIKTATEAVKITIVAMFFSVDCAFVIRELENRKK
ncbi:MAG TPA: hypothetical protein PLE70_07170 [Methanolinea sp.]|nr:hypothetical protein [Methanolinea sp.]